MNKSLLLKIDPTGLFIEDFPKGDIPRLPKSGLDGSPHHLLPCAVISYKLGYLEIRSRCQCAKCKPRQGNEQRIIEFHEEIARLRMEKPRVEPVGHYGITLSWPSGCSSGIYSFSHLRTISEEFGTQI